MRELIVDSFAGGGGASLGIEMATGRSPDIAINHDAEAIALHAANHPTTRHLSKNVWKVDPIEEVRGQKVGLAWFSPDCKHFSKAKGGKPVSRNIRDLAWVVVLWARRVRPRIIMLENVEEFRTWGPLDENGMPCPVRKGQTFKRWVRELRKLGYVVEFRELRACDYGAPTIRKRLFLIARCDGLAVVWPEPTHGAPNDAQVIAGRKLVWRTAAECIDWSRPCPSIFLTREEGRLIGVNRPLADATMARIAKGVKRYVIDAAKPFIVNLTHQGGDRTEPVDEPMMTLTGAHRGEKAIVTPFLAPRHNTAEPHYSPRTRAVDEPMPTVDATANAGVLVAPVLSYGQQGGANRDAAEPFHTITASTKDTNQVIVPVLAGCGGRAAQSPPKPLDEPMNTITAKADQILIAPHMSRQFGASVGSAIVDPVGTVTAGGGGKSALVAAFLAQHNTGVVGHAVEEPVSTIVQKGCTQGVVAAHMINLKGSDRRMGDADAPAPTVTSGGYHIGEVRAFLTKYYGPAIGHDLGEPLHTATAKARFGLVTVQDQDYQIVDIGMRMLMPRELFNAQSFPPSYKIDIDYNGKPLSKTAQIRMCGNSVPPVMAKALVTANFVQALPEREAA
jgi:DNA (cytosine-5)-methyltransferase 1